MADYTLTAKLTADAKGFQKGFDRAKASLANLQDKSATIGTKFKDLGKYMNDMGNKLTKRITVPAVAATSALGGLALFKGFGRLTSIDEARAKLLGLGHDGESVEKIMTSANDSVLGTSYGLDEAATIAASAVAAGIKPGKELTRYLSLAGDTAAIAGSELNEMGPIFNKIQTSNKAYNDSLQQLSDRGLPIYQWLAKEANTTEDAIFDMASNGEISSKMFLDAIETNIGGAAKTVGDASFMATIKNIGASIGRIGANFLDAGGKGGGFFSTLKPLLVDFKDSLATVEDKAADLGVKFGEAFNGFLDKAASVKAWFDDLSPPIQSLILKATGIGAAFLVGIGPALKILGTLSSAFGAVFTAISFLISPIGLVVAAIVGLGTAFGVAMAKSEDFRAKVFEVFDQIKEIALGIFESVAPILSDMWEKGKEGAASLAETLGETLLSAFEIISEVIGTVVEAIGGFVTGLMEGFESAGGAVNDLSMLFLGFSPILKVAMTILKDFGPQIAESFQQIIEMVMPILTQLGETLGELAAAVIPLMMNALNTLVPIIIELGMVIMDIITEALPIFLEIFQQIVPLAMSLVETIIEIAGQLLPLASVIIDTLIPVVMQLISTFLEIVSSVAPALIAIIRAVIDVFDAIIPVVMSVLTTVVQVMANIISAITPIISFVAGIISSIISIISPIVTFIAGIISSIFSVIQPITSFVSGVFNNVFSIISGVFRSIMSFISSAISTVSGTISRLSGAVSGVFNTIFGIVSSVMGNVSSTITGVFSAIEGAWNGLTGFVSNVFSGISTSVETLVGQVKGFINGVTSGINSAIGIINKIPGVEISKIPQLARGTEDWPGGFARMNEGGRGELVKLPDGTQVIPHDASMAYAREAGKKHRVQTADYNSDNAVTNEPKQPIVVNVYDNKEAVRAYVNENNAVEATIRRF